MKSCSLCQVKKELSEFNRDKYSKDGLRSACRDCTKKAYSKWYRSSTGNYKKKEYDKARNKEYIQQKNKRWRDNNTEKHRSLVKAWATRNPDKIRDKERRRPSRAAWYRKRRKENPNVRIAYTLRGRLNAAIKAQLKGSYVKKGSAIENLGMTMPDFIKYLEALFQEGMSWENYGEWHIDHIRPLSGFDLSDPEQTKCACHFTNLQPLWAGDNIRKGSKGLVAPQ